MPRALLWYILEINYMKVNQSIFRDYDIRGSVGKDLSGEFAYVFGKAYGTFLRQNGASEALVGYDARETSPEYYQKCIEGLQETGIDVIRVGMVTSPMIYWARKYYHINGAVVITASHNPPEYNGFKPCFGNGAMFGQGLQFLKKLMISEDFVKGQGKATQKDITNEYIEDITSKVKIPRELKIIVDCGNATGSPFAPVVFERLGAKVTKLFCEVDSKFPNHPPDPVDPRAYPAIVEKIKNPPAGGGGFDMGILLDGDADRLGIVDELGNIVRGDLITALCARKILKDKPGSLIEFELQCSKSATDDVVNSGGEFKLIRVGHSYIEEALVHDKAELAGETSGHIFFADRWYGFDDAIYAAARFMEYVAGVGKTVSELVASLPQYISTPQTRIFAPDGRKFAMVEEVKKHFYNLPKNTSSPNIVTIDGVRLEWPDGWAVIRASNTQPQLTLRAEATGKKRLDEIKKIVEDSLKPYAKDGVKVVWGKVH